ncbi:galactokinase [Psychromonas sp. SR45-3]|uniref:galactokinase n=1 Tax=Psychromonas sp. SR45-3 TaxID=2760930 RepID=UPI0015FB3D58|nr:galactokinase [Psychromonas sp. SR45-3]MBB1271297.1 galactokinase [Psychromonas sp. SR45-3]
MPSKQLKQRAANAFQDVCGYPATTFVQAPGRVNLIGEHTDYNDGFVMPCAIDYQAVIACAKRDDGVIRLISVDYDHVQDSFVVNQEIKPTEDKLWANYMRGVIHFLKEKGYSLGGADIAITGNVPLGSGLSSSAALEVVTGQAMKVLYELDVTQSDLALIGQASEHNFAGCKCGIMDQMISACGEKSHALLLDCRSLESKAVHIPESVSIMIVNSHVTHSLVDGAYNALREQCEEASRLLGKVALRDATLAELDASSIEKGSDVYKRAHHVISENERTVACADALIAGDLQKVGEYMYASHASMRDDFEITVPEIDYIVEVLAEALGNKGGARMTGGGFGGCCVALMPTEMVPQVQAAIEAKYQAKTGIKESIYICTPQNGAGVI